MTKPANLLVACLALSVSQRPKSLFIVPAQFENDIEMSFTNKREKAGKLPPKTNGNSKGVGSLVFRHVVSIDLYAF